MSDPATSFEEAVHANDAGTVGRLLDAHPLLCATLNEPLPRGAFGATPLLVAVQHKDTAMIDLLLRHGADINARSRWWAGGFGVLDSESGLEPFLIDRGARVDACAASRLGMLDTLAHLVASNPAVVHRGGGDGQTPLHFANSVEIAAFLLAHGAGIDAVDIDHESTPAQYMLRDRQDMQRV